MYASLQAVTKYKYLVWRFAIVRKRSDWCMFSRSTITFFEERKFKMDRVEYINNDAYFMEVIEEMILINDNYSGLVFLNSNLEQIRKIKIFEDLSIYSSLMDKKRILLFCPDNNCFVYFDFKLNERKIISLGEFKTWVFSPLHIWEQNNVLLSDYAGHFVNVDLKNGKIEMININNTVNREIRTEIEKLGKYQVYKIFREQKKALVYFGDSKIRLIDYDEGIKVINEFEKENYYDFDWTDGYMIKVSENKIEITYEKSRIIYNPVENHNFLRGKIMNINGDIYIYILSALKSNEKKGMIEKKKLS